jgi:Cyclin D1 binding domain
MSVSTSAAEFELPEDRSGAISSSSSSSDVSSSPVVAVSEIRKARLALEEEAQQRFVQGADLHLLRKNVLELRNELQNARMSFATKRVSELERAIVKAQQVDAEYVYQAAQERLRTARVGTSDYDMWLREAHLARSVLPQFHLEGLWVGKYSEDGGFELINVTYHGDTLIAHKVTSMQQANVPKGQATFQVNLGNAKNALEPIELGEGAARQWGSKYLSRFRGQGQVAAQGHRNAQWIDGHLILVGEYFSFAWLPIGHQVFFGRPSADLTLQLLKEARQSDTKVDTDRAFLTRCWEETELLQDELETQDNYHSLEQQDYYNTPGCFE